MRQVRVAAWIAAIGAVSLATAGPGALASAPGPAVVASLPPGQHACPDALGALVLGADASGYGLRSAGGPPLLLSSGLFAYLQSARRPVPHVAALVAAQADSGRVAWRVPLAAAASPTALAALAGNVAVALRAGLGVRVETFSPSGARDGAADLPWPAGALAPDLTSDGRGGLILSGPVVDLPAALGGLGPTVPPLVDVGPTLAVRWRAPGVGDLVALGGGIAVAGVRTGGAGRTVRLTALSIATGSVLWRRTLHLGGAPDTATFGVGRGALVAAFTWPGGGSVVATTLAHGHALWQAETDASAWVVGSGVAVGGPEPWQPPAPITARALAGGRTVWRGPAAAPVAVMGGRVLAVRATASGPQWLWVTPPSAKQRAALGRTPSPASLPAPEPPVAVYCQGPGSGAALLAPQRPGDLWRVAAAAAGAGG